MLGHLRLGKIAPIISVVAKEVTTAMTATCKQTLIEAISELDSKSDSMMGSNSIHLNIPLLPSELWLKMIENLGERLIKLLVHIKVLHAFSYLFYSIFSVIACNRGLFTDFPLALQDIILLFKSCADSALYHACDTSPSFV